MRYRTASAFRAALEQRLLDEAQSSRQPFDRLRRRIAYERIAVRLDLAEPGVWVMKGGLALDVRLGDQARATKDLDLGLREAHADSHRLRDRIIESLSCDPDSDWFTFAVGPPQELGADLTSRHTWRYGMEASLAGRTFASMKLDISPRPEELGYTERLPLHNFLSFAGIETRTVEVVDVNRQAAEKVHALTRTYGNRPNSRVRDLVDLVLLLENDCLSAVASREAVIQTFQQRGTHDPPDSPPNPPSEWNDIYPRLAEDVQIRAQDLADAMALVRAWWSTLRLDQPQ